MSCCGDNFIVPGANPANTVGGVESVGAGTPNVTITGTASNPLVNVSNLGGVTQVEGQIGNVNLNGVGMTIAGGFPVLGDVTFTANVQNITGSGAATVTQFVPGTFNVAVPNAIVQNVVQGPGISVTQPTSGVFQVASVVQNVTGSGGATVTQPTPGNYQVAVPVQTVTNITGSGGGVTVTQPTAGVFNVAVPPNPSVTGSGIATVTQPTAGVFNVAVPAPTVTNVTGSGSATVTQPTTGTFNISVPIAIDTIFGGGHNAVPDGNGLINLTSPDNSVTIDCLTANTVKLTASPNGVTAINAVGSFAPLSGYINFQGIGATQVTTSGAGPSTILFVTQAVTTINPGGASDTVTLASADNSVLITASPTPGTINFAVPAAGINSITSTDNSITVTNPSPGVANLAFAYNTDKNVLHTRATFKQFFYGTNIPPGGTGIVRFTFTTLSSTRFTDALTALLQGTQGGRILLYPNIGLRSLLGTNTNTTANLTYNIGVLAVPAPFIFNTLITSTFQPDFQATVYNNMVINFMDISIDYLRLLTTSGTSDFDIIINNPYTTTIYMNHIADEWGAMLSWG